MAADATVRDRGGISPTRSSGTGAFERIFLALVPLLVALAAATALLLAAGLIEPEQLGYFGALAAPLAEIVARDTATRVTASLVALVVGVLAALLALRALGIGGGRPAASLSSSVQRHVLMADDKGVVVVESSGVAAVAAAAARRASGVTDVTVNVVGRGASPVRLEVTARVSAAAELRRVGDDVRRRATEAVQTLVGIEVSEVVVRLDVVPLEELGRELQ